MTDGKNIQKFLNNIGYDKLFLCCFPLLCGLAIASNLFFFNPKSGIIFMLSSILIFISIKIFDDFTDYVSGNTALRAELEKTGINGFYKKCDYFVIDKKSPRQFFYLSLFLFVLAFVFLIFVNIFVAIFLLTILILAGFINYYPKFNKIISFTGTEFLSAFLCGFLNIVLIFFVSTGCLTLQIIYIGLIVFFMEYFVFATASLLNIKPDIASGKTTIATTVKNINLKNLFYIFISIFPYILTFVGIYLEILPKLSWIVFLLSGHSLWHLYLMIMYEKEPHKLIKWHFLMGDEKYKIENEQNNLSWYTVRYCFARNIFISFVILLIISFVNWSEISML